MSGITRHIPNTITSLNLICGSLGVICAFEGRLEAAFYLMIAAAVFDFCDGLAARVLGAYSETGKELDSLSDMVTFGVAPAALVAIMTHSLRDWELNRTQEIAVYILSSVYLGCAALRLATYNVHAILEKKSSEKFSGLPSPGAAAAICVTVVFAYRSGIRLNAVAFILPCYAAVLGLLMVSPIPYIHFGKWLVSVRRNRRRMMALIVMLLLLCFFQIYALTALVTLYVLSGPVMALFRKFHTAVAPSNP